MSYKVGLRCPINPDHGYLLDLGTDDPDKALWCPHSDHPRKSPPENAFFTYEEAQQDYAKNVAKTMKRKRILTKATRTTKR